MLKDLGSRFGALFARLFRRKPPAAGYFVKGEKMSLRGWVHVAPWLWPSREYLLYVPLGYGGWRRRRLLVLIHGCRQTPEEFAKATRITALADEHGWLVLLPRQTDKANAWSCWNWFDTATSAGRGEVAIVAAQIRAVRRHYRVHPKRIVVAGFSAGGSLATALAVRHPEIFAGAFVHSGIACGAASGPAAAVGVMRDGANTDCGHIGVEARAAAGGAVRLPLIVLQGGIDPVVAEINASQVARQFLALNGYSLAASPEGGLPQADAESTLKTLSGRTVTTSEYRDGRRVIVRMMRVTQLGHAWSGGDPSLPFNDAEPPDATKILGEFIEQLT